MKCNGKGSYVCNSCGGQGKWYTYSILNRKFTGRHLEAIQDYDWLPRNVSSVVEKAFQTARPNFESFKAIGEQPDSVEDPDILSFAKESFERLLRRMRCTPSDSNYLFSITTIPVARIEYQFIGKTFIGYYVGENKEFISHGQPLEHLYEMTIRESENLLKSGKPELAIRNLLPTLEMAASDPKFKSTYREALSHAIENGRKKLELTGLWVGPLIALFAPSWITLSDHLWGTFAAAFAALVPIGISRTLKLRACLCNGRAVGAVTSAAAALGASAWSWLMPPVTAVPMALITVAAVGVAGGLITRKYLTSMSAIEENHFRLIMDSSS
ncbi:MAG: hypothetical protein Kow00107_10960 [Planctomycetota bacterium]